MRLLRAHVDLARAEFAQLVDEIKRLLALAGVALGALLLLGLFLPIGLALFMGEWLFGSIGWGVLHGSLMLIGIAVTAGLTALGASGIGRGLVVAVVVAVIVGILFAFDQPNVAWTRLGETLGLGVDPAVRPLVVGTLVVAGVGAIIGLALGAAAGGGAGAIGGLIGGGILGALLGAFSAITFGPQAGAAVGVTAGLLAWPIVLGAMVARTGVDGAALKARFWPSVTIETAKETIEWVRAQTPLGPKA